MKKETNTKKVILPMIIMVLVLILLVVGSTYAYFTVSSTNSFGQSTGVVNIGDIGSVSLESTGTDLSMDLTAMQMIQLGSDTTYYASSAGVTTSENYEEIGLISVTGEGTFNCSYTIYVSATGTMYEKFQEMATKSTGQIILTINGTSYDFNTEDLFPFTYSGTANGITESNPYSVEAQLKIVNKTSTVQTDLAGSYITITFSKDTFDCSLVG